MDIVVSIIEGAFIVAVIFISVLLLRKMFKWRSEYLYNYKQKQRQEKAAAE